MTSLKLNYPAGAGLGPISVRVIDRDLTEVAELVLTEDSSTEPVPLEAGFYCIRARPASGPMFDIATRVEGDETKSLTVEPRRTNRSAGRRAPVTSPLDRGGDLTEEISFGDSPKALSIPAVRVWLRVFELHGDPYQPGAWTVLQPRLAAPPTSTLQMHVPSSGRSSFLQIGGDGMPWRCIALPPSPRPVGIFTAVPPDGPAPPGRRSAVRIELSLGDTRSEALLRSLQPREHDAPDAIAERLANAGPLAEEMLRGKFSDTAAGVIGGYFLLDRGYHDRLHDWPGNLAMWFPWLADGPVLRGWQIIRNPDVARRDPKEARGQFLEACRRGLPVLAHGLRLLRDGLGYFAMMHRWDADRPFAGDHDAEVLANLNRLSPYVAALDPDALHTTFTGRGPAEPGVEPVTGRPAAEVVEVMI